MLGFTLAEISDVLAVWIEDQFTVAQKQACLHRKLEQLEEKAKALAELRAGLINALNKVGQRCVDVFETVQLTCQRIGDICNMKLSDIRDDGTAPTVHEQRSLSERLYR
nr:Zn(II)-responsive transcriptional regulator [Raoultella sp. NCTC 9187]